MSGCMFFFVGHGCISHRGSPVYVCVWGAASKLIGGTASTCIEERSDPWKGSHELRHISEKVEAFSGRVNVVRRR